MGLGRFVRVVLFRCLRLSLGLEYHALQSRALRSVFRLVCGDLWAQKGRVLLRLMGEHVVVSRLPLLDKRIAQRIVLPKPLLSPALEQGVRPGRKVARAVWLAVRTCRLLRG